MLDLVWGSTNIAEGYMCGSRNLGGDNGIADKRKRLADSGIESSSIWNECSYKGMQSRRKIYWSEPCSRYENNSKFLVVEM